MKTLLKIKCRMMIHVLTTGFLLFNCEGFVQVDAPENVLVEDNVFQYDASSKAAVLDLYSSLASQSSFAAGWLSSLTYLNGLNADELILYSTGEQEQFFSNNILPSNSSVSSTWGTSYNLIYSANAIIEGLRHSNALTPSLKDQLTGEALVIRAFCHFYLANLYGDLPYVNSTNYRDNAVVSRSPKSEVLAKIINDLKEAEDLLHEEYESPGRVRINKWCASTLLSRVHLYAENWAEAEASATDVISNSSYSLEDLDNVFKKDSKEAIWQLFPAQGTNYALEGDLFILSDTPEKISLNDNLVQSFEVGDLRKDSWINSITVSTDTYYFPFKYKENNLNSTGSEYSMILRLAELYLIRAEARAKQGKLTSLNSAESDLNIIRARAGLSNIVAATEPEILAAIENERRHELFTEWAHRWFDLKRTKRADEVLSFKTGWQSTDVLWPIPQSELLINRNLAPQNLGY